MKSKKAILSFEHNEILEETIKTYNKIYKNSSRSVELKQIETNKFEIAVSDDGKLLPYGIYDIASFIGSRIFREKFKLSLCNKRERIYKRIYNSTTPPTDENKTIIFDSKEIKIELIKTTGINSSINTIIPYISEEDYKIIIDLCELKKIEYFNSVSYKTKNDFSINYSIEENYLMIFGVDLKYGKEDYKVDLEGIFELKPINYDI
ncbi:hypothetical protein NH341_14990 [Tenacibaculum sp. XPcli2-G]|uniref:hypothetical protein n=1 Tax=Tenacibaculum sp. XPcli2-G TaxID=2954503 RepID=UPI0020979267|nr:hypothetical protein [Tenacibaculum sp. XPcli2-G]MCO7186726.1 hypothetical protein [Tenacibaculum sp. XPcli2-G]